MGIGGGTILIPALTMFVGANQHIAQGVNLLYFIPTAVVALFVHKKNNALELKIAIPIILFGIAGAGLGSFRCAALKLRPAQAAVRHLFVFYGRLRNF